MARFDVYLLTDGLTVVDCQADHLLDIATRFVVPLMPGTEAPPTNAKLNPIIRFDGDDLVLVAQLATAVRVSELRRKLGSVAADDLRILGAIDVLIGAG